MSKFSWFEIKMESLCKFGFIVEEGKISFWKSKSKVRGIGNESGTLQKNELCKEVEYKNRGEGIVKHERCLH